MSKSKEERQWLAERSLKAYALMIMGLMLLFLIIDGIRAHYGKEPFMHCLVYVFIAMAVGPFGIVAGALTRVRTEISELRLRIARLEKGITSDSQTSLLI